MCSAYVVLKLLPFSVVTFWWWETKRTDRGSGLRTTSIPTIILFSRDRGGLGPQRESHFSFPNGRGLTFPSAAKRGVASLRHRPPTLGSSSSSLLSHYSNSSSDDEDSCAVRIVCTPAISVLISDSRFLTGGRLLLPALTRTMCELTRTWCELFRMWCELTYIEQSPSRYELKK
jgi:hypothetical protein